MAKVIAKVLRDAVSEAVSALFERTKARLQGRDFKGNSIYFQIVRDFGVSDSIEGIYRDALVNEIGNKGEINKDIVESHNDEVSHLIDALKSKTTNQALDAVKGGDQDAIKEVFEKAKNHLNVIITTELARTQNTALEDAATQVASDMGIGDPVMFAIGKYDDKTCKYCKTMFHCASNPVIPRVWKLSEMQYEYMKPKTWSGEIHKPPIHPRCFSKDTEILTDSGWMFFKDLSGKELILSVNPCDGKSEWVPIKEKVSYIYNGELDHISNKWFSLMTTPDHNHVIISDHKKKHGAKESDLLTIKTLSAVNKSNSFVKTIPNWIGESPEFIEFGDSKFKTEDFCEFMGYWLSEGHLGKIHRKTKTSYRIVIAQEKYPKPMIESFVKMFNKIPSYDGHSMVMYSSKFPEFEKYLTQFGKSWEKFVPKEIKKLDKRFIRIFLDAYCLGDGSRRINVANFKNKSFTSEEVLYHTSSDKMCADLSELILKMGKSTSSYKTKARLTKHHNGTYLTKHPTWLIAENISICGVAGAMKFDKVKYNDYVYDVELEKFHTLFVRHNKKVSLSGNCRDRMTMLSPGFGFDSSGKVVYKSEGYDEYTEQRRRGD